MKMFIFSFSPSNRKNFCLENYEKIHQQNRQIEDKKQNKNNETENQKRKCFGFWFIVKKKNGLFFVFFFWLFYRFCVARKFNVTTDAVLYILKK